MSVRMATTNINGANNGKREHEMPHGAPQLDGTGSGLKAVGPASDGSSVPRDTAQNDDKKTNRAMSSPLATLRYTP